MVKRAGQKAGLTPSGKARVRAPQVAHWQSWARCSVTTGAVAHAATKRELVAKQRPPHWTPPGMFRQPETLTEAEVIEAEAELKALQRHALEVVDPEAES
jgi:hypothetical protein